MHLLHKLTCLRKLTVLVALTLQALQVSALLLLFHPLFICFWIIALGLVEHLATNSTVLICFHSSPSIGYYCGESTCKADIKLTYNFNDISFIPTIHQLSTKHPIPCSKMDMETFESYENFWSFNYNITSEIFEQLLGLLCLIALLMALFVKKAHPVAMHSLLITCLIFLITLFFICFLKLFHPKTSSHLWVGVWVLIVYKRLHQIWETPYLCYLTVYLCFQQLALSLGSSRLSKLSQGIAMHCALITIAVISWRTTTILGSCSGFKVQITKSTDNPSDYQFYITHALPLILILIDLLIRKIRARGSQVYAEPPDEQRRNSFWVLLWFQMLVTLKLLAALNITLTTVTFHPALAFFSHFILCQPQILSQVVILVATCFSGPTALTVIPSSIHLYLFWKNLENEKKNYVYPLLYQFCLNTALYLLVYFIFLFLAFWNFYFKNLQLDGVQIILTLFILAFLKFHDTCFLIILFLLLSVQRLLTFSPNLHRLVTGFWLKAWISVISIEAVIMACVREKCLGKENRCFMLRCTSVTLETIQNIHFAITITAPFLSLYFNYRVYKKVSNLSYDISNTRKTVELNIILQSTPIIIFCVCRAVVVLLMYMEVIRIESRATRNTIEQLICVFPGPAYIFIPLGYIFGNIDRLKKIKRFITRGQYSAEIRPVSSTHSQHPLSVPNQNNVIDQ